MAYDQEEVDRLERLRVEADAYARNKIRDGTYTMKADSDWELEVLCIDHDMALAKGLINH
jgi:hypothetical protein